MRKKIQPGLESMIDYVNNQSGWTEVNKLKNEITELEKELLTAQTEYKHARQGLASTSEEHRRVQAELNSLSLTKHAWTDEQFGYYQQLLATDRKIGNQMAMLDVQTKKGEERVDRTLRELMEGLRRRFHEEQLWTERIRMLSMWSTIAILTANSLIFLITFLMRSRESAYIRTAVKKIREDLEQQADMKEAMSSLKSHIERLEELHSIKTRKSSQEPPAPAPKPEATPSTSGASDAAVSSEKDLERRAAVGWYVAVALGAGWLFGRSRGGG